MPTDCAMPLIFRPTMAESHNLTVVLKKTKEFEFENRSIPEPKTNEVLLRIENVGICGSDVHYWWEGRCGRFVVNSPIVLGHEASGIVMKCGLEVRNLKPGDRVAIEPGIPCRQCTFCKAGNYNVCPEVKFCATPPIDGTLTQYFCHPEDFCFRLPKNVSLEEGAMVEPLSVAFYSCRRAEIGLGSKVLILGAGPIGLMCAMTARAFGATSICTTDINCQRLEFASKQIPQINTLNVKGKSSEEAAEKVIKSLNGRPTAILECSGVESAYKLGVKAGAPKSILVTIGRGPSEVTFPIVEASVKEIDVKGIFRYANCYKPSLETISSGKIDLLPLISHRFSFEETEDAFQVAKDGSAMKVMIKVNKI